MLFAISVIAVAYILNSVGLDLHDPLDDMYNWLDFFEPKMNEYKAGEFSGEELLSILRKRKRIINPDCDLVNISQYESVVHISVCENNF